MSAWHVYILVSFLLVCHVNSMRLDHAALGGARSRAASAWPFGWGESASEGASAWPFGWGGSASESVEDKLCRALNGLKANKHQASATTDSSTIIGQLWVEGCTKAGPRRRPMATSTYTMLVKYGPAPAFDRDTGSWSVSGSSSILHVEGPAFRIKLGVTYGAYGKLMRDCFPRTSSSIVMNPDVNVGLQGTFDDKTQMVTDIRLTAQSNGYVEQCKLIIDEKYKESHKVDTEKADDSEEQMGPWDPEYVYPEGDWRKEEGDTEKKEGDQENEGQEKKEGEDKDKMEGDDVTHESEEKVQATRKRRVLEME